MKIDSNRPIRPGAGPGKAKQGEGSNFLLHVAGGENETSAASGASGPGNVGGIEALFALQEVPDATTQRKRAVARGEDMLDRLEDLKIGLLLGRVSRDKLSQLAHLARSQSAAANDPKLRDILQEIELRAEVELAKLAR